MRENLQQIKGENILDWSHYFSFSSHLVGKLVDVWSSPDFLWFIRLHTPVSVYSLCFVSIWAVNHPGLPWIRWESFYRRLGCRITQNTKAWPCWGSWLLCLAWTKLIVKSQPVFWSVPPFDITMFVCFFKLSSTVLSNAAEWFFGFARLVFIRVEVQPWPNAKKIEPYQYLSDICVTWGGFGGSAMAE